MHFPIRVFRKDLFFVSFAAICLFTFGILPNITFAQITTTTISITPSPVTYNPGESFTVDITIADVLDLYTWGVKIRWTRGLLVATSIVEGSFLSSVGSTTFVSNNYTDYLEAACTFTEDIAQSGSGVLMSVTFLVRDTGESLLDIYYSSLTDYYLEIISHIVQDGYFSTTRPVASFKYSPNSYGRPLVGESVTFDASASFDPDGGNLTYPSGIVSYDWDLGDSSTATGRIVTHTYDSSGDYNVTLLVTDNEGETYAYSLDGRDPFHLTVKIKYHDIAVLNVTATPREVKKGSVMTIEVKVTNSGSHKDTFNITAYYFDSNRYFSIQTKTKAEMMPQTNATETFQWNTTNVAPGSYDLYAYAYLVDIANLQLRLGEEANTANNALSGGAVNVTMSAVHDIAILSVSVSTEVKVEQTVTIGVLVKNEGNVVETFSVNVYNGTSLIGTQTQTLTYISFQRQNEKTVLFSWFKATNTTVQSAFNISAQVPPIIKSPPDTNETDIADNTRANVTGIIRLLPVASFTFSPSEPILDQTVTFDASASYAPGLPAKTIASYSWDFGDGSSAGSGITTTHAYHASKTYSVSLTIIDSDGLSSTLKKTLVIPKVTSTLTISASVTTVPIGSEGTVITGSISPVRIGVNVSIYYAESGEETWFSLATATTGDNSQYSYTWTPWLKPGTYEVQANWTGDGNTFAANSSITIDVILKKTSTLDISVSQTKIMLGESIAIDGSILPLGEGVNITIWHMPSGSVWSKLAEVATDADGEYAYNWEPQTPGTYAIRASWSGDEITSADESDVQIVVVEEALAPNIFLYSTIGLAVALVAAVVAFVYFLRFKKPKSA